jgi:hypothetical protein
MPVSPTFIPINSNFSYISKRQSRSRPAPRSAPAPAQTRGAHTAAAPAGYAPPHAPAPPAAAAATSATAQRKEPGLLTQMAATAGSVAVGSTIGHGISSMLFGSSHAATAAPEAQAPPVQQQHNQSTVSCEVQAKGQSGTLVWALEISHMLLFSDFTKCLEKADLPSCTWYLEQLKAVSHLFIPKEHAAHS